MNTHGHEHVAAIGKMVLDHAFRRIHGTAPRLNAFYLGNWLTDVSQAIDPVAYASVVIKFKTLVDKVLDEMRGSFFVEATEAVSQAKVAQAIDGTGRRLKAVAETLLGTGSASDIAQIARTVFRAKGYFKFAHPASAGDKPPLDFDAFLHVFDNQYTQYFPHEHLDRPENLPSTNPSTYDTDQGDGSTRSPRGKVTLDPDMYKYLRDDIEVTAALLAEIDLNWASDDDANKFRHNFQPAAKKPVDDTDKEWNLSLAKLGHAMHAIEDFFAHSNYSERAALILGGKHLPWSKIQKIDSEVFGKRLKRFSQAADARTEKWRELPEEKLIVTGYFDFQDTLISLAHLSEEMFGIQVDLQKGSVTVDGSGKMPQSGLGTQIRHAHYAVTEEFPELLNDTLEFIHNPKILETNPHNKVAKYFSDKVEEFSKLSRPVVADRVVQEILSREPLFKNVPAPIAKDFTDAVIALSKVKQVYGYGMSIFEALKNLTEFLTNPIGWIKKFLVDLGLDWASDLIIYYTKERVYDFIGAGRIGCHSLIAKDHGPEWLYNQSANLATAVHWYVMRTMTRWSRPHVIPVSKSTKEDTSPETHKNTIDRWKWIDWLELLEFFLRNPAAEQTITQTGSKIIPVQIEHTVKAGDSLASLAVTYKATAVSPPQFTWEKIADANYGTAGLSTAKRMDIVNHSLKNSGLGYPVAPPNYAFKPGIRVIIPDQAFQVPVYKPAVAISKWYRPVMDFDYRVMPGYIDFSTNLPQEGDAVDHHTLVYLKERAEVQQLVDQGKSLRAQLESKYKP